MECIEFQKLIDNFIFDKIEYSDDLEEFIEHAKKCKKCSEELELYYTIRRGLGDLKAPDGSDDGVDSSKELESIMNFYNDFFMKQEKKKKSIILSIMIFLLLILFIIICLYLNTIGII